MTRSARSSKMVINTPQPGFGNGFSSAGFSLWVLGFCEAEPPQAEACATFGFAEISGVGHKIHAAPRERMAARDAAQRKPRTAPRAVDSQGLGGVVRAGRIKLAGARHQRRKKSLVHAHGKEQRARRTAHVFGPVLRMPRSRRTSSASRGANAACATVLFGCMTMSHPVGISVLLRRKISRMRRLMRFRTTAPPRAFLTLIPKRLVRVAASAVVEEPSRGGSRPMASFGSVVCARKKTEN